MKWLTYHKGGKGKNAFEVRRRKTERKGRSPARTFVLVRVIWDARTPIWGLIRRECKVRRRTRWLAADGVEGTNLSLNAQESALRNMERKHQTKRTLVVLS